MIIDNLPTIPSTVTTGDELPIERGTTTYKIDYNALAAAILAQAVKKTGDTMTGSLTINGSIEVDSSIAQKKAAYPQYYFQDNNGVARVELLGDFDTTNSNDHNRLSVYQKHVSDNNFDRYYFPLANSSGNSTNYDVLTTKSSVTVQQGGTGQTGVSTLTATATSTDTRVKACSVSAYQWGKVIHVRVSITVKGDVTSFGPGNNIDVQLSGVPGPKNSLFGVAYLGANILATRLNPSLVLRLQNTTTVTYTSSTGDEFVTSFVYLCN